MSGRPPSASTGPPRRRCGSGCRPRAIRDVRAARQALRTIQERWESIGMVPRDSREQLEGRLRRIEEAVRAAEESEWRRTNPEARARAEATVTQLRASIQQLEARL